MIDSHIVLAKKHKLVDAQGFDANQQSWFHPANERHQASKSDHNPDAAGVVQAIDITHDPRTASTRASSPRRSSPRGIRASKYLISNAQIISRKVEPWVWRPYNVVNAHRHHVHISVDDDPALYDNATPWLLDGKPRPVPAPAKPAKRFTSIVATDFGGARDRNTSAYDGHMIGDAELGVALPVRFTGPRARVRVIKGGASVICSIVDVGPWNTHDPYWERGTRPQAESGTDLTGRHRLTPAAARAIGLPGMGLVDWGFVDDVAAPTKPPQPKPVPQAPKNWLQILLDAIISIFKGTRR